MGSDKRTAQRFALEARVEVRYDDQVIELVTQDISDCGAFLNCNGCAIPAIGTQLTIQMKQQFGDGEPAPIVNAVVVRTTVNGIGVKFC